MEKCNFAPRIMIKKARKRLMKRLFYSGVTFLMPIATIPTVAMAQDRVKADIGADLVSSYIWRGQHLDGFSIQPSVSLEYKGFSLSAWGTVGLNKDDTREIDLTVGYATGGFSVSVTDYWSDEGIGYFHYGAQNTAHTFEAQIGYDFDVLAVNWYTNFAGTDGVTPSGKRAYSSYFSVTVPFALGGLNWTVEAGATPWGTDYYNYNDDEDSGAKGFEVCDVSIGVEKEIPLTKSYSLPVFAKVTWNPATEGAYFAVGLTF